LIDNKEVSDATGAQEAAAAHASAFAFQVLANLVPIVQTIGSNLNLISEFAEKTLKILDKTATTPMVQFEQVDTTLQIVESGVVREKVAEDELKLNEWDEPHYKALRKRIKSNWDMYNTIYGDLPIRPIDEKVRLTQVLNQIKEELCSDFRGMMRLFNRIVSINLDEYRLLYDVCGMSQN
jgi:hypothetical protein